MAKDNPTEVATWTGQGIAHYSGQKRRDIGSVFCRTSFTSGKLAFLNNMVGVFEYETDEMGNSEGKYGSGNSRPCYRARFEEQEQATTEAERLGQDGEVSNKLSQQKAYR